MNCLLLVHLLISGNQIRIYILGLLVLCALCNNRILMLSTYSATLTVPCTICILTYPILSPPTSGTSTPRKNLPLMCHSCANLSFIGYG